MKRTASILLVISILLSALFSVNVSAAGELVTIGDLTFRSYDTYCVVYSCDKAAEGEIFIPSSVEFNGNVLPLTTVRSGAFTGCAGITGVTIPDGVTSIGSNAFMNCTGLVYASLPDSVVSIGTLAFYNCSALKSISIPDGVTSIASRTFYNCSSLTQIFIPDGIISIGDGAFEMCGSLSSVTIPGSVTSLGLYVFSECTGLVSVQISDGVTYISERLFYNCTGLKSVAMSGSVTSIGDSAFYGCTSLKSVNFPESITSICSKAFYNCRSLESVTLPASLTSIDTYAFYACFGLKSIIIPDSITLIEDYTFGLCKCLENVVLSPNLTTIGKKAFTGCSNLSGIAMPESVTTIKSDAFSGCTGLKTVDVPDLKKWCTIDFENVTSNPLYAGALLAVNGEISPEIIISDGVTTIKKYAFSISNRQVGRLYLPESLTTVEKDAFCNTSVFCIINNSDLSLSFGSSSNGSAANTAHVIKEKDGTVRFRYSSYNMTDDGFLYNYADKKYTLLAYLGNEETITLPEKINGSSYTVSNFCCGNNVIIPETFTQIKQSMFENSDLKSVVIPATVKKINKFAFNKCSMLEKVTFSGGCPDLYLSSAFRDCFNIKTIINDSDLYLYPGKRWNGYVAFYADTVVQHGETLTRPEETTLEAETEKILYGIIDNDNLSELEKALLVHDRLVMACEYAYDDYINKLELTRGTVEAALVDKYAVCDGYANAYLYLLQQLGIECTHVVSNEMNHALNIVDIDGSRYYVDATWDDSVPDTVGQVSHYNFLRSYEGIYSTGHTAKDIDTGLTDTTYDYAFWQVINSSFVLFNGEIYCIYDGWICRYDNGQTERMFDLYGSYSYNHSFLSASCESLYFNDETGVYAYVPGCEPVKIFSVDEGDYLYGFKFEDGKLCIELNGNDDKAYRQINCHPLSPEIHEACADNPSVCSHCGMMLDPTKVHTLVHHEANAATHGYKGNIEYWECTGCGKLFSDKKGENEIVPDDVVIPAIPHTYGQPVWEWSDDLTSASVTISCTGCAHTVTQAAYVSVTEESGVRIYTATAVVNGDRYVDEKREMIEYTVIFIDWDGTVISENTYHYLDAVDVPDDPARPSDGVYEYTFAGWDKNVTAVNGDEVYTAIYTREQIVGPGFEPGDINGDGSVDNQDVVALFRYISGGKVSVVIASLDPDGDGDMTNKDVVYLFRFVSGAGVALSQTPYAQH